MSYPIFVAEEGAALFKKFTKNDHRIKIELAVGCLKILEAWNQVKF